MFEILFKKIWLVVILGTFSASAYSQLGFCSGDTGEAIFSEDFGSGTTNGPPLPNGFTTYTYVNESPQDGFYTISSDLSQLTTWHSASDRTPDDTNGKAFIVNASFTADEFFRRTISDLCENTFYEFSAWVLNLYDRDFTFCPNGGIPVNIRFEIWNASDTILLASGDTGDIIGTRDPNWEQYGLIFETAAGQESVLLKMINNGDGGCGNDLAIDDIEFRACGDTTVITAPDEEQGILICEDQSPLSTTLVAVTDFEINNSYEIQWQSSADAINWNDISGATQGTYTPPPLTESTFFRVNFAVDVSNLGSPFCSFLSDPFLIEIVLTPDAPTSNGDISVCSTDSIPELTVVAQQNVIVNWYSASDGGELLASNTTSYTPVGAGTFYAEAVSESANCPSVSRTDITLSISPSISFDTAEEELTLCEGESIELTTDILNVGYSWSTGASTQSISVSQTGSYSVTAQTSQGCTAQKTFIINSAVVPEIIPVALNVGTKFTIKTANEGAFEYSINGFTYRSFPTFKNLPSGLITAFARSVEGCLPASFTFYNIATPNYFTPNNDGINDVFTLPDLSYFSKSELQIFDRFGKLLYEDQGPSIVWDGSYNGTLLPVNTYWYILTLDENRITGNVGLVLQE